MMQAMGDGDDIAHHGPRRVAAWALAAPEDAAQGMRAVLMLADGPVSLPAREAARLISERHSVDTVRRMAARVAATLGRAR